MSTNDYSIIAKIYDPLLHYPLKSIRRLVVRLFKYYNVKEVIDLCCGTGEQLYYLKNDGFFTKLVGIELDKAMFNESKKYGDFCINRDARNTKFKAESFDGAIISFALHEMPWENAKEILKEATRILKKDGILIIVDYSFLKPKLIGKIAIHLIERFAGKEHYNNFKNFLKNGGIYNLVDFSIYKEKKFFDFYFNTIGVWVFKKNQN